MTTKIKYLKFPDIFTFLFPLLCSSLSFFPYSPVFSSLIIITLIFLTAAISQTKLIFPSPLCLHRFFSPSFQDRPSFYFPRLIVFIKQAQMLSNFFDGGNSVYIYERILHYANLIKKFRLSRICLVFCFFQ